MSLAGTDDVAEAAIRKWAAMWRSITLSTLEHTYLPYYSYIRYLDLEGLRELLRELYINGDKGSFFTPEMDDHLAHDIEGLGINNLHRRALHEASSQMMPGVAKWIRSCKALQRLELRRFMDDTLLLAQILPEKSLRLSSLSLAGYSIQNAHLFHEALHHQQSLQYLDLNGIGSDQPEHNEPLFQAISKLNNLRELDLYGVANGFTADDVMALTHFLPHLEKLLTGGKYFRDNVWNAFIRLPKLKNLMILGRSEFSAKGILDFINQLGPGNRGFSLSILDPTSDTDIDDMTAHYIRDVPISKFDGLFDFATVSGGYFVFSLSSMQCWILILIN
ncbi:hypothetical protein BDV30DRAFT_244399 [Aspergillus minisclerotigenes]|uniref:F-box domain-containing protein n=1 Tax=Aspergillus minisclerotigenes TaxID=656917 RepID=A0A5N6IQA5_9EURO|nr:hypothetical protein BDV30DRAFT_244399 [Aspergillus minisclerotigenes]